MYQILFLQCSGYGPAEITELVPKLSNAACREDELSYYETKLVVIQVVNSLD